VLEWILRGLRAGSVTTAYPRAPEHPPDGFRGSVDVVDAENAPSELADVCPTRAIRVSTGKLSLDQARCVLCAACVAAYPTRFRFRSTYETASRARGRLLVGAVDQADIEPVRASLAEQARALRRSIHVRHVDAGSDGSEEWEISALTNPYYDMQRLGLYLTSAPRHADVLLVTGSVTRPMRAPLERAYEVMPAPKVVVAAGTEACSGALARTDAPEGAAGVDSVLPVDVYIPGSPPSPIALLHGLLLAIGVLSSESIGGAQERAA
jgi:Ni,Fe-hydrogenase III small subunit/ferredoxin